MKIISLRRMVRAVNGVNVKDKDMIVRGFRNEGVDERYIESLYAIYYLIFNTDFTDGKFKDIFNPKYSYDDVTNKYSIKRGTLNNFLHSTIQNKIKPLTNGKDLWELAKEGVVDEDLDYIEKSIKTMLSNYEEKFMYDADILNYFSVNLHFIDNNDVEKKEEVSGEEFEELKQKMATWSKIVHKETFENTNIHLLSYGIYLLKTDEEHLSDEDRIRKEELMKYTGITR